LRYRLAALALVNRGAFDASSAMPMGILPTGAAMEAHQMKLLLSRFLADESGATAIEYGLLAAGIALAIITIVNGIGTNLNTSFTTINSKLTGG
jgi:pilus assembly protein Flp/PilA